MVSTVSADELVGARASGWILITQLSPCGMKVSALEWLEVSSWINVLHISRFRQFWWESNGAIAVPAEAVAPSSAKASAGTVLNKCDFLKFVWPLMISNIIWQIRRASWWCHAMKKFPAFLALCEGNPPVMDGFPSRNVSYGQCKCFLCCQTDQAAEQTIELSVVWITMTLTWSLYNVFNKTCGISRNIVVHPTVQCNLYLVGIFILHLQVTTLNWYICVI